LGQTKAQEKQMYRVLIPLCSVVWLAFVGAIMIGCNHREPDQPASKLPASKPEATSEQVHAFCGACHAYPPPDSFPRSAWMHEVQQGFDFLAAPGPQTADLRERLEVPRFERVVNYYEHRAPAKLPVLPNEDSNGPLPVRFESVSLGVTEQVSNPAIANVNLVHLTDARKLDLLVCEMRAGKVLALKPYEPASPGRVLASVPNPAHAEVVDLDGDGIPDIIVANLGSFIPTDKSVGSVVWLRGRPDGTFTPITLLENVGRVADVQAADFNGDGKLDLIVAVFGLHQAGEVLYLENRTTDWNHPQFVPHVVDDRHGAIHVPVCDLNGDGRPDFVALISQEHETVVAFLNEGGGRFRKETIYTAPHPAYGSTGIQLVDLDGDGRLDVLLTHGDVLDQPFLLKPYHGIHWLQNPGHFPFVDHLLTRMYGVHRAVAADFEGNGRLGIVATSFLPGGEFPQRAALGLDAVIYLQQTAPGHFVRHSLEKVTCDHATCAAGAWDGDGKVHFVTGSFCLTPEYHIDNALTLWKNLGPNRATEPPARQ
jgi:hypothetical protein